MMLYLSTIPHYIFLVNMFVVLEKNFVNKLMEVIIIFSYLHTFWYKICLLFMTKTVLSTHFDKIMLL